MWLPFVFWRAMTAARRRADVYVAYSPVSPAWRARDTRRAATLKDATTMNCFNPQRQDWVEKTDQYLRS